MANFNVNIGQFFAGGNPSVLPGTVQNVKQGDTVTFIHGGDSASDTVTITSFDSGQWTNTNNIIVDRGSSAVKTVASGATTGNDTLLYNMSSGGQGSNVIQITAGDSTPDQFTFNNVSNRTFGVRVSSNTQTISGIDIASPVSVSGTGGPQWRKNGGSWTSSSGTVVNGDTVQVSVLTATTENTGRTATLNVGGVTNSFTATTGTADVTITMYAITDGPFTHAYLIQGPSDVIQGQTVKFSHTTAGDIGSMEVSGFNTAAWETLPVLNIARGSHYVMRTKSNADFVNTLTAQFSAANNSQNFTVSVLPPPDLTPNTFGFTTVNDAQYPSTQYTSNQVALSGYNRDLTVTPASGVEYSLDGGVTWWTNQVNRPKAQSGGANILIRMFSGSVFGSSAQRSVTVGNTTGNWTINVRSALDPNEFIQTRTTQSGFAFRADVQEFFAGDDVIGPVAAPTELSAFVRGGPYVPNITQNNGVPTSSNGMKLSDFVGSGTYLSLEQGGADRAAFGDTTLGQTSRFVGWQVYPSDGIAALENPRVGFGLILGGCQVSWTVNQDTTFDQFNVGTALSVPNGSYADNRYVARITATAPSNSERTYKGTITMRVRLKADTSKILTRVFNYSIFFKGP